jgi:hypothetical protein
MLMSAALAGWVSFHYWGPYKWAAQVQTAIAGTHWVQLSFLITWVIVGLPFFLVALVLDKRLPRDEALEQRLAHLDALLDGFSGKLLLGGVTIAATGGWLGLRDATAGPLTTVSLRSLEAGEPPPSLYVDLTDATPVPQGMITLKGDSYDTRFVPLVAGEGKPVVFAKLGPEAQVKVPCRGQLEEDGLPGEVRTEYEKAGVIGPKHYTLYVDRNPAEEARFGGGMAALGVVVAGVGFGMSVRRGAGTGRG